MMRVPAGRPAHQPIVPPSVLDPNQTAKLASAGAGRRTERCRPPPRPPFAGLSTQPAAAEAIDLIPKPAPDREKAAGPGLVALGGPVPGRPSGHITPAGPAGDIQA
ncbi:hypothetical protein E8E01_11340 [Methylorubrum populi]|nr:hypothetical protein E8E01_11340 [Methylorubrum populi]